MWSSGLSYSYLIVASWNDTTYSVFDSDGEFLLIEAAEALPSWVKPTNSENRVRPYSSW